MTPRFLFNIQPKYPPRHELAGDWAGVQKGIGYEFWGLRKYEKGDSCQHIDWKARARTGNLYVKEFSRDSAFCLVLLCDVSPSMRFGDKPQWLTDIALSLAHAALRDHNPCALLLFADGVVSFVPPSADPRHLRRIEAELQRGWTAASTRTRLQPALQFMRRRLPACLGIILSDFNYPLESLRDVVEAASSRRAPAHEMVAFHLLENAEYELDGLDEGGFWVRDMESGEERFMDLNHCRSYVETLRRRRERAVETLSSFGIDSLVIPVEEKTVQSRVNALFRHRLAARI